MDTKEMEVKKHLEKLYLILKFLMNHRPESSHSLFTKHNISG